MAVYIFSYELRKPGKDYNNLYSFLKQFTHCHHQTSTWFLDTPHGERQLRDAAQAHIDSNDTVFVARLSQQWAAFNTPCGAWLNDPSRNW